MTDLIAYIYCRVSSIKQTKVGDGLSSQETRCREFARMKNYKVAGVFTDDVSGSLIDRPGMKAMLAEVRKKKSRAPIVIIDDVSRLARGLDAHLALRAAISKAGGRLESPSIEFGEDPDSILVENLLASVSQHQRQKNGEQTINRMRARLSNGYWVFQAPIGYRYARVTGHGKMLVRDEPHASTIQEALEGYASGRFETQAEAKRFLESVSTFPKDFATGELRNQRMTDFLTRPVYAGYVEAPKWGIGLIKGHHQGLISFETFQKIQRRLHQGARAPARTDINADFPLRGFIACGDCGGPLSACWSKGQYNTYPYYLCPKKGCASYRKSIPRARLEGDFEELLQSMQPTPGLFKLARAMFEDAWDQRAAQAASLAAAAAKQVKDIDKQIDGLVTRIVEATSPSVIAAYEKRVSALEAEKIAAQERAASIGAPRDTFEQMFERACTFLSSPWKLWLSGNLGMRRTVLRLAFSERLAFCRREGFRTAKISLPFKLLDDFRSSKNSMARRPG